MCADEIKIVHMDDDIVVVNKPASIPVGYYTDEIEISDADALV